MKVKDHSRIQEGLLQWRVGNLGSEALPKLAEAALGEGIDSLSLRILAGESFSVDSTSIAPLAEKVASELDLTLPEKDRAAIKLLQIRLGEIADGKVELGEGLLKISSELSLFAPLVPEIKTACRLWDTLEEYSTTDAEEMAPLKEGILASVRGLLKNLET